MGNLVSLWIKLSTKQFFTTLLEKPLLIIGDKLHKIIYCFIYHFIYYISYYLFTIIY